MSTTPTARAPQAPSRSRATAEVLLVAGRLGLTSFGGPVAHVGYFRAEYVDRRRWLGDDDFADLVGLCQLLPGPASSQLGIAIGMHRAGLLGGLAAWIAFTAPSAAALIAFAALLRGHDVAGAGWVHGLKLVAVAVVAQAVWTMWRSLAPDRVRSALVVLAALVLLLWTAPAAQVAVIVAGGVLGRLLLAGRASGAARSSLDFGVSRRVGTAALAVFAALLLALPLARAATDGHAVELTDSFYRSGALVFGGGHVVLPLLESRVVPPGWVTQEDFLAGYGAAQAVPGPLFTFAAYLGAVERPSPNGVAGGTVALLAIFLPAFLLVIGTLPFWSGLRRRTSFLAALAGVNAAVVGLLLAALYDPVFTGAVDTAGDLAVVVAALAALALWRLPPWAVVAGCALAGELLL
ncbi:MAG TPA: chromate efflux transporter [Gaiellaceae bacterium]|nr:chromate efflux transporter [Gaiellaceae bacterium]